MVVVELCKGDKHDETGLRVELYLRSWSCRIPVCRAAKAAFGVLGSFVGLLKDRFCTCDDIYGRTKARQESEYGPECHVPQRDHLVTYAFSRLHLLATMITFKDEN
jgi:hypothetical protein